MAICLSAYQVTGIVSLIVLLIGIAIQAALKWAQVSHALKLSDKEIVALRGKVESLENEKSKMVSNEIPFNNDSNSPPLKVPAERFDEKKESILLFLASHKDSHIDEISSLLNYDAVSTEHNLEVLKTDNFVRFYWRNKTWNVTSDGHKYIARYKLIT